MVQANYEDSSDSLVSWILDSWTDSQLKSFLDYHNIPNPTPRNRDSMLQTARGAYSNIASIGPSAYDTLFGSWQDSDLKAWCDERGIPVPQGSTKESMLASLRKNTKSFTDQAKAAFNELTSQSVGDKIFDSWSESQLKEMLDSNGIPVPQGSKTNELRALARKNYKSLKNSAQEYYAAGASSVSASGASAATVASASGASAYAEAKKSAESAASQGSKTGKSAASVASKSAASAASVASKSAESLASSLASVASKSGKSAASVASKSAESLASEASKSGKSATSVVGKSAESLASEASKSGKSATSVIGKSADSLASEASKTAGSMYGKATDAAASAYADVAGSDNLLYKLWSDSRLKSFLDARGVPVPQNGKKDDLIALVRENSRKARISAEDFEGWSEAELKKFAKDSKIKLNKAADSSRDELIKQTSAGYTELSKKGDAAASAAKKQYEAVKAYAFDSWSDSELKAYLDSYGVEVPQNGAKDQLVAAARKNGHYFSHGSLGPAAGSGLAQMALDGVSYLMDFVKQASGVGYNKAAEKVVQVKEDVKAEL